MKRIILIPAIVSLVTSSAAIGLFCAAMYFLSPGSPDSGRVPLIAFWDYYGISYRTGDDLILLILSLLLMLTPFVVTRYTVAAIGGRLLAAVLIGSLYITDWLSVRAREVSTFERTQGDHGVPGWATSEAIFLLAVILVAYVGIVINDLVKANSPPKYLRIPQSPNQ